MNDFRPAGSSGGGAPSGAAGGSLTGTYPNPTIATIPSGATATTQSAADASTKVSTTAYVDTGLALKANLAGPTFTGSPVLPTGTTGVTQSAADGSTKLATTAYVDTADALKATLASPTLTGTPAAPTATAGDTTTQVATTAYVQANNYRAKYRMRTGAIAENYSRSGCTMVGTIALGGTGVMLLTAIELPINTVVSSITFTSGGTAISAGTHQWFCLTNSSYVQLATTTDDTSTAWAANSEKTLSISTIASGASATFTTTYTGVHYCGILVSATTMPTLEGVANDMGNKNAAYTPLLCLSADNLGAVGPVAFAKTYTSGGGLAREPWVYLK